MNFKKLLFLPLLVLFTGCSITYDNVYEKITADRMRPLEMITLTTDNAPGTEVTMQASFAGKSFDLTSIDWRVSWEVVVTPFSSDVYGEQSLAPFFTKPPQVISNDGVTAVVEFSYIIPESIVLQNRGIPAKWGELVAYYIPGFNPADYGLPTTTDSVIMLFDSVAALTPTEKAAIPRSYGQLLNSMSQVLTVQYEIYADVPQETRMKARYSTRYHASMEGVNGMYVNHTPTIDSLVLRKTADADKEWFDPSLDPSSAYHFSNDTLIIPLAGDSSYWLCVYAAPLDSTLTFEAATNPAGQASLEAYNRYVFYDDSAYNHVDLSWLGYFHPNGFSYFKLLLDEPQKGDSGMLWLTLTDERAGESNRPVGRILRAIPYRVE